MPGIGKTTNALEYAHRIKEQAYVRWLRGDSKEKLNQGLREWRSLVGTGKNLKEEEYVFKYLVDFFSKEFNQAKEVKFLIVVDNLELNDINEDKSKNGYSWIEYFLVNMPQNVQVLITCRNANIFKKEFKDLDKKVIKLEIKYFTKEQAKSYFYRNVDKDRTFSKQDKESLEEYFSEQQILAYDLHLLVKILEDDDFDVSDFFKRGGDISQKIFEKLYKRIEKKSEKAWETLEYMSFLDPNDIPIDLMKELSEIYDKVKFRKRILQILEDNGVVETYSVNGEVLLKVHRRTQVLVKLIIAANKKEEQIIKRIIHELDNEMPRIDVVPDEKWTKLTRLIPHALKIKQNNKILNSKKLKNDIHLISTYYKITRYYNYIKFDQEKCLTFGQAIVKSLESLYSNKDHLDLATSYNNLASTYREMNKLKESEEFDLKAIQIKESLYPNKDHLDLVSS